jgi:Ca2+-binding RTX toxin-like protein
MRNTRWLDWRGSLPSRQPVVSHWSDSWDSIGREGFPGGGPVFAPSPSPAALTSYSLTVPNVVIEGDQATFTITRSGDKPAETLYFSALSDGSANWAERDFSTTSGGQPLNIAVSFSSGTTSRTVTLNILDDGVNDSGEQFRVILQRSASDPASVYIVRSAFVTINDAPSTTDTVREGTSTTHSLSVNGSASSTIDQNGINGANPAIDKDWYRVTLTANHEYEFSANADVSTSDTLDEVFIRLYDASGNQLSPDRSAEDDRPSFTFAPTSSGTYYLAISAGGSGAFADKTGAYTVSLDDNGAVATDNVREGSDTTHSLSVNGGVNGTIDQNGIDGDNPTIDKDWYRVTLVAGHEYEFSADADISTSDSLDQVFIRLYDANGNQLNPDRSAEDDKPSFLFTPTSGGIYYITISAGGSGAFQDKTGTYRIELDDRGAAAVDTVREGTDTTSALAINNSVSGRIDAEPISGDGVTSDQQGGYIDKDWYRVTLDRGHIYTFNANSTSVSTGAVAISLYNASGSSVRSVTESASPSFTFDTSGQSSATQTYYFAISAGGPEPAWRTATGNYSLGVTDGGAPPPPPADDFRDDQTDTTAPLGSLTVGSGINGYIGPADSNDSFGDKDVFQVNLTAGQIYDFRLRSTTVSGSSLPAGVFTIRDNNFNQLEISGSGSDEHEIFTAERTGTYYVRVGSGGTSSDTGGYRLEVNPVQASQVPDDWADDPNDTGVAGTLSPGANRLGAIESSGDKDYFTVTLQAGKVYHFSVDAEARPGAGAIGTLAMSLRGPNNFNTSYLDYDDGTGRANFDFQVNQSGIYYLRVGAGTDGSDTGGYRISVGTPREPVLPPPLPALPTEPTPADYLHRAGAWVDGVIAGFNTQKFDIYLDDEIWNVLKTTLRNSSEELSLATLERMAHKFELLKISIDIAQVTSRILHAEDWREALFVEAVDWFVGSLFHAGGNAIGAFIGAVAGAIAGEGVLSGPLAGIGFHLGRLVGGAVGDWIYADFHQTGVRQDADIAYDGVDDITIPNSVNARPPDTNSNAISVPSHVNAYDYGENLVAVDEIWYLSQYPDAATAISNGAVSGVYAHFLTIGIDLGYRPNSTTFITRDDLAYGILNNDPLALTNVALFTQALRNLAGDGINNAEQAAANLLSTTAGATQGTALDATLSAIAHRKAVDLATNIPGDTIAAASDTSSTWASRWSDGSDFAQAFAADLEALLGPGAPDTAYGLFVTASSSGSAADVLARLQAQQGWNTSGFDTFGIAEFGGHWVVIVADRAPSVNVAAPGADTLTTASIYGSGESESLYSGMRAGRLFGLGGNDILVSGIGRDYLDGGAGDDVYVVNETQDLVIELPGGGRDTIYSVVSYALASDAEIEVLRTLSPDATAAINFTGNAFAQQIFGNAGANVLIGEGGTDTLVGGAGNDIYRVEETGDIVFENIGGGSDSIYAVTNYALSAGSEVELLSAIDPGSTAAMNLTGNEFANRIYGNAAANVLIGGGGIDTLFGGAGHDVYRAEEADDIVVEVVGGGWDAVYAVTSYALAAGSEVELLSAIDPGATGAMDLTGNEFANYIYGNAGANVLIGGGGIDRLFGGAGGDIYRAEEAGDIVVEAVGGGVDSIYAVTSYALAAGSEVELLSAIDPGSTGAMDLTGNEFANRIYGNTGANVLIGGGGIDTLFGGGGNDVYRAEEAGDLVIEAVGGGVDAIYAVTSYVLGAGSEVELLSAIDLGSAAAMNLAGNEFANRLYGTQGHNILNGGGGNDVLNGFGGADSYLFTTALGANNVDTLVGFVSGTGKICLDDAVFAGLGLGAVAAGAFVAGTAAADVNDRIIYDQATGRIFLDADGSGAGAAILFAVLQGGPTLAASDFLVI